MTWQKFIKKESTMQKSLSWIRSRIAIPLFCLFLLGLAGTAVAQREDPSEIPAPDSVTIAGTLQTQLGCASDWAPECEKTFLTYDAEKDIWTATFELQAGSYEYKAALNGSWDDNYGLNAEYYGANIPLEVAADGPVTFFYDHKTRLVNDSINNFSAAAPVAGLPAPATSMPDSVTIAGTIQSVLGCAGDWDPACTNTALTFDAEDQLWAGTFTLPAGDYEYKAALNGTWDVNFGGNAEPGGANIPLSLADETAVTFYFDSNTGWVTDSVSSIIANVPGDFQEEIGCPGDWQPDCLASWLQDPDGDGNYTFMTLAIPAGEYEAKVAINQSWAENYGDGGAKDGANMPFQVPADDTLVSFLYDSRSHALTISVGSAGAPVMAGNLSQQKAHWVSANTIAWDIDPLEGGTYFLNYSPTGNPLILKPEGVTGGETLPLTYDPNGLSEEIKVKFPQLANFAAFTLPANSLRDVKIALKGQVAVTAVNADGQTVDATGLQIPGVLDDLYTYDGPLGVIYNEDVPSLALWAPTARSVKLHLFADGDPASKSEVHPMRIDPATGVWSITGEASWTGQYYLYEVQVYSSASGAVETNLVTDPYSVSLALNSTRSQIINLKDTAYMPEGWQELQKPPLNQPEDIVVYELHIRDFSVNDPTVPAEHQGTYLAFTDTESNGMKHLIALAQAGLTHIHLLPTFDIATINEDKSTWQSPSLADLAALPPDSDQQQALISELRDKDPFNWGYDPFHYNVPEGSYATDPNGPARILEYRQMVQALNQNGLRVVADVVYNHTNASGQNANSVLDKIVPGYYHRLNGNGKVETSTCCQNTATEHNMMRKLMIDSTILWATAYKVDAFRFDLMGHHMKADMVTLQDALHSLTLENDGVDGSKIYIYGEGWNFGEVADNARGVNATQANMAGTGIGTFNDRLRDAVRGGSPFGGQQEQGFINGLFSDPNGFEQGDEETQRLRLLHFADLIRIGLAGNLKDYQFINADGNLVSGLGIDYNGQAAGYTADPQENIVYVSKHDNESLFDIIQYKAPTYISTADRVRMNNLGESIVLFSQGVPFFQAGTDMLRSKSMDRNSYNSGDWFNRLDFSYQSNNWAVGLPMAGDNQAMWPVIQPLLADPALQATPEDIATSVAYFRELLQIRQSSPLFHLPTADEVMARLTFQNTGKEQLPGLIVMSLSDRVGENLDPNYALIVVLFNAHIEELTFSDPSFVGLPLTLHPVQANSVDSLVGLTRFIPETGTFVVPGRTTAVYVLTDQDAPPLPTPTAVPTETPAPAPTVTMAATVPPTATIVPTAVDATSVAVMETPLATSEAPEEIVATETAPAVETAAPVPDSGSRSMLWLVAVIGLVLGLVTYFWSQNQNK